MSITINALARTDLGKGASRRLRRQEKIPAIVYGVNKTPATVTLGLHEITHLLEDSKIFTSIVELNIDGVAQSVIIKDLQRSPARNEIVHVDFQRIDLKQTIVTRIPLQLTGATENPEMRLGAVINQFVNAVEVSCLPNDLPNFIDVDISALKVGTHLTLGDLIMPKGVQITALSHGEAHNQTVISLTAARKVQESDDTENAESGDSSET